MRKFLGLVLLIGCAASASAEVGREASIKACVSAANSFGWSAVERTVCQQIARAVVEAVLMDRYASGALATGDEAVRIEAYVPTFMHRVKDFASFTKGSWSEFSGFKYVSIPFQVDGHPHHLNLIAATARYQNAGDSRPRRVYALGVDGQWDGPLQVTVRDAFTLVIWMVKTTMSLVSKACDQKLGPQSQASDEAPLSSK